jgi:AcrR family transcriptional regulator
MAQTLKSDLPKGQQHIDPRILRSRRMLMEALARLLTRKPWDEVSIQEIADEATLNRATFYLHYPDKNSLLQAMAAARFQELVERRGLSFSGCEGGLRAIALGVCDYLAESPGCPGALGKMPIEGSIIPVVEGIFREGAADRIAASGVDPQLVATTAAWAVFGAACSWLQSSDRIPAEEMAGKIEAMVMPILQSATQQEPEPGL